MEHSFFLPVHISLKQAFCLFFNYLEKAGTCLQFITALSWAATQQELEEKAHLGSSDRGSSSPLHTMLLRKE